MLIAISSYSREGEPPSGLLAALVMFPWGSPNCSPDTRLAQSKFLGKPKPHGSGTLIPYAWDPCPL